MCAGPAFPHRGGLLGALADVFADSTAVENPSRVDVRFRDFAHSAAEFFFTPRE